MWVLNKHQGLHYPWNNPDPSSMALCPCPLVTCLFFNPVGQSFAWMSQPLWVRNLSITSLSHTIRTSKAHFINVLLNWIKLNNTHLDWDQKLFTLLGKGSTSEGPMVTKVASTGNGRNPMALVTSCGMSRENKVEFSGMRHTHGIQLYRKLPWQVIFVIWRTLTKMPLTELRIKDHLSTIEAPAWVSHSSVPAHSHCLGKPAGGGGSQRKGSRRGPSPSEQKRIWQGKDISSLCPSSQPIRVILRVPTRMLIFSLNHGAFPILRESYEFRLFSP